LEGKEELESVDHVEKIKIMTVRKPEAYSFKDVIVYLHTITC